jgi:putative PIN family toxin of toxin-antitoxin system
MRKIRVVLDTNVLVAGVMSKRGASHQILLALPGGNPVALASVPLFLEYEAVLRRADVMAMHGLSSEDVDVLLAVWAKCCRPVHLHYLWRPQLRDPKDEMVLETAINGGAEAIVTFNKGGFQAAAPRFNVALWTPAELLHVMRSAL